MGATGKIQRYMMFKALEKALGLKNVKKFFLYFDGVKLKIQIDDDKILSRESSEDEMRPFIKDYGADPKDCEVTLTKEKFVLIIKKDGEKERRFEL